MYICFRNYFNMKAKTNETKDAIRLKEYGDFGFTFKIKNSKLSQFFISAATTYIKRYEKAYESAKRLVINFEIATFYMDTLENMRRPEIILSILKSLVSSYLIEEISLNAPAIISLDDEDTHTFSGALKMAKGLLSKENFSEKNISVKKCMDIDLDDIMPYTDNFSEPLYRQKSKDYKILIVKFKDSKINCFTV